MSKKSINSLKDLGSMFSKEDIKLPAYIDGDEMSNELTVQDEHVNTYANLQKPRIYLDRKQRKGKVVTIIAHLEESDDTLIKYCKSFKSKCGVGGSVKAGQIILQGDQQKRILTELINMGYTQTKLAGG